MGLYFIFCHANIKSDLNHPTGRTCTEQRLPSRLWWKDSVEKLNEIPHFSPAVHRPATPMALPGGQTAFALLGNFSDNFINQRCIVSVGVRHRQALTIFVMADKFLRPSRSFGLYTINLFLMGQKHLPRQLQKINYRGCRNRPFWRENSLQIADLARQALIKSCGASTYNTDDIGSLCCDTESPCAPGYRRNNPAQNFVQFFYGIALLPTTIATTATFVSHCKSSRSEVLSHF